MANLIRSVFSSSYKPDEDKPATPADSSNISFSPPRFTDGNSKKDVIILSNADPNEKRLDALLGGFEKLATSPSAKGKGPVGVGNGNSGPNSTVDDVKVDVTLRTQLGQAPVIMLLFAVDQPDETSESANAEAALTKVSISLEVGLNGRVSVVDMTGLLDDNNTTTTDNMEDTPERKTLELQSKIANVLEISQDIGILVEWILRWARQRKGR